MRMKTKTMNLLLAAALCLMCCAACTDAADIPDADAGTTTGAIRFTAVRPAPLATRSVSGNDRWKGDGTEKIGVNLYSSVVDFSGTYTITAADGTATALVGDQPVCWPNKFSNYSLYACYPLPGMYDITDQSTPEKLRQADFLLLADKVTLSYVGSTPVSLRFRHAMAKVRVELTGINAGSGEIKVEIWGNTGIYLSYDAVRLNNATSPGYITACRDTDPPGTPGVVAFEAMFFSYGGSITKQDFIRITIGSKVYHFTPDADTPVSFHAGRVYTYRITIPSSTNP